MYLQSSPEERNVQLRAILHAHNVVKYYKEDFIRITSKQAPFELEEAVVLSKLILKAFPNGNAKVLLDPTQLTAIDTKARKHMVFEVEPHTIKMAIVVRSFLAQLGANIMVRIDQPDFELKMFMTREDAENWLKEI